MNLTQAFIDKYQHLLGDEAEAFLTALTQEEVKKFLASSSKDTKQENVVEENKVSETEGSSNIAEEETNTPTTEQPQETSAEPVSTQGMAGTYSGSAAL